MSGFSPDALARALAAVLPSARRALCVAFSGGMDSTVLMHALARLRATLGLPLRALHVDHQLARDSSAWSEHCARVASMLGIPCEIIRVEVDRSHPSGLEAAAREARYAVLAQRLLQDEALLTAQHADDQLETLLLALLRGAGVAGLAGMPPCMPFAQGWRVRPLLEFTRADLATWAGEQSLEWIEDPSNRDTARDRNLLRHRVLPLLRERWPAGALSAARTARHVGEAAHLLVDLAGLDLHRARRGRCLDVAYLLELPYARSKNLLRHWLREQGLPFPPARKLASLLNDLRVAGADRVLGMEWAGQVLHRYRALLYCETPARAPLVPVEWQWRESLTLPAELGTLSARPGAEGVASEKLPTTLMVRWRRGGERLRPAGHAQHRELKKLLAEAGVLPWWRERVPLLYAGEKLIAVGDLWVAQEYAAAPGSTAIGFHWQDRPHIFAASPDRDEAERHGA